MYVALCLFRDQLSHIKPIELALENQVRFVYSEEWHPSVIEREKADIIIGINEHHVGVAECYAFAKSKGIPTLTLQDGILEWRHMFENPLYDGKIGPPLHAPVLADKIACIGLSSATLIGNLGNWHKVELTGMPKMDGLKFTGATTFQPASTSQSTILVLTSSKPWFNEQQREIVLKELKDLKTILAKRENVTVVWRLTKELPALLGVENMFSEKSTTELSSIIQNCDAVITTISTTILEAQLMEKPTAIIDYFNTPNFIHTRWTIRHASQIEGVLDSMLNPTVQDKFIQDHMLHQNIDINPQSAISVASLVVQMITHSRLPSQTPLPVNLLGKSFLPASWNATTERRLVDSTTPLREGDSVLLQEVINRLKYQNQQLEEKVKSQTFYFMLVRMFKSLKRIIKLK